MGSWDLGGSSEPAHLAGYAILPAFELMPTRCSKARVEVLRPGHEHVDATHPPLDLYSTVTDHQHLENLRSGLSEATSGLGRAR
jgi:hypothetical protein